jgi:hypothetical protein
VHANDAENIKAHAFFTGIDWENLHKQKPPRLPRVANAADTKYFDQESAVSDFQDFTESELSSEFVAEETNNYESPAFLDNWLFLHKSDGLRKPLTKKKDTLGGQSLNAAMPGGMPKFSRPKDRILRDENVGKEALKLRRHGAFMGYTYRRPPKLVLT